MTEAAIGAKIKKEQQLGRLFMEMKKGTGKAHLKEGRFTLSTKTL